MSNKICPICEKIYGNRPDCSHSMYNVIDFTNQLKMTLAKQKSPEFLSNQMKLLRMDFINYTSNLEKEFDIMKKWMVKINKYLSQQLDPSNKYKGLNIVQWYEKAAARQIKINEFKRKK